LDSSLNPQADSLCVGLSWTLLWRYLIYGTITIAIYYGTRKFAPYVLEPLLKMLGIKAHYMPYGQYKEYLTQAIKHYSFNPSLTNGKHNGHVEGENSKVSQSTQNGHNGHDENQVKNGYTPKNPAHHIHWVRLCTKLIQYCVLGLVVSVIVPRLAIYSGI